jgi:hypothetical protein
MSSPVRTHLTLDAATVQSLFAEGDWPCVRIGPDTWRTQFRTKRARFPVLVRVGEGDGTAEGAGFVTFAIIPYLRSPEDPALAARLYTRLLELNHQLMMAKYSIDDDLDVVLTVEYPTAEIDRSEFVDALNALGYYADLHHDELRALLGTEG